MAFNKQLYAEYQKRISSISDDAELTDEMVEELFDQLLPALPNNGRIYKYKALSTFHIDELIDKYVWFSTASQLNDNHDCSFNANIVEETNKIVQYLLKNDNFKRYLAKRLHLVLKNGGVPISYEEIENALFCIAQNGSKIATLKLKQLFKKYRFSSEQQQEILRTIKNYSSECPSEKFIKSCIGNLKQTMMRVRDSMKIFAFTSAFDKDSMWAYYCQNKGICIEYDLSKIKDVNIKRIFVNTQKVRYGRKAKFNYVEVIKGKIEHDPKYSLKVDSTIINQLTTKNQSWRAEEEWRILLCIKDVDGGVRVPVDMISAIYLDYSILYESKTAEIIEYAYKNGWDIRVRYFSSLECEYRYETIERIEELERQLKAI